MRSSSAGGAVGIAAQSRAPHTVSDARETPRFAHEDPLLANGMISCVAIPMLLHGGGLSGVLTVYDSAVRTWREDEVQALAALAATASAVFSSAELYQRVAEEKERSEAILANIADGIVAVDRDGNIVLWNATAEQISGVPAEEALGRRVSKVLQRDLAAEDGAPPGERTLSIQRGDKEVWLSLSEAVMLDAGGAVAGRVFAFRDVSSERVVEQMKSDFVATVSHELRTPLTSIYGFAETLMRGDVEFSDAERATFLGYIASESGRLIDIVDDLLSVARLETGTLRLNIEEIDIGSVAGEVVARDAGARRALGVRARGPERGRRRRGGPREALAGPPQPRRQRGQVLTGGRPDLDLGAAASGERRGARLRSGRRHPPRGPAAHLLEVLPRREHRGRRARDGARPLPGARAACGDGREDLGRVEGGPGLHVRLRASRGGERRGRAGSGEGDGLMALTVLVIDDEDPIRLLCRVNLEAEGTRVLEAENGHVGLELAREERPDAILLDVMMPGLDGWTVAERLLEDEATRRIPIIFLTARADVRDRARGLGTGGLDYITKPFNPVDLAAHVEEVVDAVKRGEREELRAEKLSELRDLLGMT